MKILNQNHTLMVSTKGDDAAAEHADGAGCPFKTVQAAMAGQ